MPVPAGWKGWRFTSTEQKRRNSCSLGVMNPVRRPRVKRSRGACRRIRSQEPALHRSRPRALVGLQRHERSIFVIAERLVQIWCSNERELAELQVAAAEEAARSCLPELPRANPALGDACLERLENAYESHLARLCENRLELSRLLPVLDAECQPLRDRSALRTPASAQIVGPIA